MRVAKLLGALFALLAMVAFAACGDDGGGDTGSETTDEATGEGGTCDPATAQADLTAAMSQQLGAESVEEQLEVVDQGDVIEPFVTQAQEEQAAAGETLAVTVATDSLEITNESDTEVQFTFGIAAQDDPEMSLADSAGVGVCVDGEWLIAASTVCDTITLGYPDIGMECLDAIS